MATPLQPEIVVQERKPFKIRCSNSRFKGVVASSLTELKKKACEKFEMDFDNLRIYLNEDGTEIDDEEYFLFIPEQSKLIVSTLTEELDYGRDEDMTNLERSEVQIVSAHDATDAGGVLEPKLKMRIITDPTFFVSLNDEELEKVVALEPEKAMRDLKKSKDEIVVYQDSCEQELHRRTELREATELLKLYKRAVSKSDPS